MKLHLLQRYFGSYLSRITLTSCLALLAGQAHAESRFDQVWEVTQSGPYSELPHNKVTFGSFYEYFQDKLQDASERTLSNQSDILPYFRKLLHPNGICFAGTWNITEETRFSGYFRKGSHGLVILRASTALSTTKTGEKRAFGLAGKIFPAEEPPAESTAELLNDSSQPTANFFVIENLGGSFTESLLDAPMSNDITAIDIGPEVIPQTPILAAAVKAFGFAENTLGGILSVRQLYPISELGEPQGATIVTPRWLKIQGQPGPRSAAIDFRDDLRLINNDGKLTFDISVSSWGIIGLPKIWRKVGYIEVDAEALSEGCDHRLHFNHPRWRHDLKH